MTIAFGTDGIRGPSGQWPISRSGAVHIGRAAARLALEVGEGRVLVGRDTRRSGPDLAASVQAGVLAQGGAALDAGMVPTSAVGIAVDEGLADVGVMITASHNPAADNGFKILGPGGRKLDDTRIDQVEAWLAAPPVTAAPGAARRAHAECRHHWRAAAERLVGDTTIFNDLTLAIDLANGAGTANLDWLLEHIPARWVVIGADPERPINDGVGSENPGALAAAVRAHGCAAGIAVDGDADRCVLVDERGEVVPGDALAWLLARGLGVDTLVVTLMSTGALEALLPGVTVLRTPVGDRHLREVMDREGHPLGCEESGHVLFGDLAGGDGLITGLRALSIGLRSTSLSSAIADFERLPRAVTKVRVQRRPPLEDLAGLQEAAAAGRVRLGAHGRVFLRYSGTEPVLRILVEGEAEAVEPVLAELKQVATEALG